MFVFFLTHMFVCLSLFYTSLYIILKRFSLTLFKYSNLKVEKLFYTRICVYSNGYFVFRNTNNFLIRKKEPLNICKLKIRLQI